MTDPCGSLRPQSDTIQDFKLFKQEVSVRAHTGDISLTSPFLYKLPLHHSHQVLSGYLLWEVQYVPVWLCNPWSKQPSVWHQSTPPSTRCPSSLSASKLLKRHLETLCEVCFHLNPFSHGPTHTDIPQNPQLSQLWGYWEASEKHLGLSAMHSPTNRKLDQIYYKS